MLTINQIYEILADLEDIFRDTEPTAEALSAVLRASADDLLQEYGRATGEPLNSYPIDSQAQPKGSRTPSSPVTHPSNTHVHTETISFPKQLIEATQTYPPLIEYRRNMTSQQMIDHYPDMFDYETIERDC